MASFSGCEFSAEYFEASEHSVPTLSELGVNESELGECLYPGGETEALQRMERFLKRTVFQFLALTSCIGC